MNDFKLDNMPKMSSGFTIPDGYFDTFSEKILEKTSSQQKVKVLSISKSKPSWYYAVAAIVTLMITIPLYSKYATNSQQIDSTTLENYLACQSGISEEEIVDLLEQEDINKIKIDINVDNQTIEETLKSNSNLEEYIIN